MKVPPLVAGPTAIPRRGWRGRRPARPRDQSHAGPRPTAPQQSQQGLSRAVKYFACAGLRRRTQNRIPPSCSAPALPPRHDARARWPSDRHIRYGIHFAHPARQHAWQLRTALSAAAAITPDHLFLKSCGTRAPSHSPSPLCPSSPRAAPRLIVVLWGCRPYARLSLTLPVRALMAHAAHAVARCVWRRMTEVSRLVAALAEFPRPPCMR